MLNERFSTPGCPFRFLTGPMRDALSPVIPFIFTRRPKAGLSSPTDVRRRQAGSTETTFLVTPNNPQQTPQDRSATRADGSSRSGQSNFTYALPLPRGDVSRGDDGAGSLGVSFLLPHKRLPQGRGGGTVR